MANIPFHARHGLNVGVLTTPVIDSLGVATLKSFSTTDALATNSVAGNVYIGGNLVVAGTTVTVNSATLDVADINITIGKVGTPTDITAVGGGITLLGTTNKTITWNNVTNGWESSESIQLATGKAFRINGVDVLGATALGAGVVNSSLTSVGILTSGTWNATVIAGQFGGTGVNNTGKTITLGGNISTAGAFTTSGAFGITLTATGLTALTLPTTGTLATLAGAEALTGKSVNGVTPNSATIGFTLAGGITPKTLTVSNTLTLAGTDGSTLNIGAGGTLGSAAFTATTAYEVPLTFANGIGRSVNTISPTYGSTANTVCQGNDARLSDTRLTTNALTFNNTGLGAASGQTFNGSAAVTISYNTIGAAAVGQTFFIGTTQVAINRATGALALTGVSIDGNAGTVTNGVYTTGAYADPAWITQLNGSKLIGTVVATNGVVTTGAYADPAWITSLAKAKVGLGLVENTALSTWAGSANITTLGTIATGVWNGTIIADAKIASALTGKTYNGTTPTSLATGFSIAGGTTPKTLTVSNTLTLTGTDGSTLNIGAGGTLGTGAFATIANYATLVSPIFTTPNIGVATATSIDTADEQITSGNTALSAVTTRQVIDTFSAASFRTCEYTVQVTQGTNFHVIKMMVLHDGINTFRVTYGELLNNIPLFKIDSTLAVGNVTVGVVLNSAITATAKISINRIKV